MLQNELVAFNIILIWACIRCFEINRGAPFNQQDSITFLVPWCGFAEETQCQIRFDVTHLPAPSTVAVFRPLPLYRPFLRPRPICAIHNANESLNSHFQQIGLGAHDLPCPRLPPQQIGASRSYVRPGFFKSGDSVRGVLENPRFYRPLYRPLYREVFPLRVRVRVRVVLGSIFD